MLGRTVPWSTSLPSHLCPLPALLLPQDLTANNLLCEDDPKGGGVRLLFSDPALALPPHLIEDAP